MDQHSSSSLGTPAPYGQACTSCAQSKCKCIIRPVGGACDRCHRLNKQCRPIEAIRRRNPKRPAVNKTARLEQKLDGLVSLIKSGALSSTVDISPQDMRSLGNTTPRGTINMDTVTPDYIQPLGGSLLGVTDAGTLENSSTTPTTDSIRASYEPSQVEAEQYLASFRTYKSRGFPFVHIPSTTTASHLKQERPFLWLCIMSIASNSTLQQRLLGSRIRQFIAQEMVVQLNRNMDLLLGILTFIGWATIQTHNKPFLSVFTQLAISLVSELGLAKPIPKNSQMGLCGMPKLSRATTPRTMEERRAVLGCFLSTSILSSFLQKTDALRWTPHMEECLIILDEKKECPNDAILVQQVRLQLIVERRMSLERSLLDLQNLKTSIVSPTHISDVVLLHLYGTELDVILSEFLHTDELALEQWKSLDVALESIKSWFNVFFTIQPLAYLGFSHFIFLQLTRCITILYRLKTLDDSTWEENHVWKTEEALQVLDRVLNNIEQVTFLGGFDNTDCPDGDVFTRAAHLYRSFRPAWETKGNSVQSKSSPQYIDDQILPDSIGTDSFDVDWFTDLFLSSN
ncbi:uncharacterized protein BDZ99DRAFT_500451 [Mytilinidion resinicola]|uniref:Zn(2)-C6 fungal-type domain-containing protein n=1 Tax=Mytilinidion resinicola TaxID=574789 RepID=A0A6A6YGP7_9PEZI|nr:uncharacterized protein BDZ99DRAFT_500451 [Mytilinidion resinicola]KAF2807184.1 hypothetical protein BDZ99DRAFT_500451 [Mytilinidion resinicola]